MHIQTCHAATPSRIPARIGGRHVLLVITDHQARYDVAIALLEAGCRLTLAASFNLADMLVDTEASFDLMVADHTLPGFGVGAVPRLAALARPGLPVLLLDAEGVRGAGVAETALQMMERWPVGTA